MLFAVRCRLGAGLRNHLESEDVLQSAMFDVLRDLPRFEDRGEGSLRHFLNVLIANKIRDRVDTYGAAKRKGTVALSDSVAEALPESRGTLRYHDSERFDRLERAMAALPGDMREVVLLRTVDGLSSKDAAALLKKSDAAVRKLYSRAMARLTRLMLEEGPS
jgi:RNA polymerase sigma-70 factor (ECF subfamily)